MKKEQSKYCEERDAILSNLLTLFETGEEHNVNVALQILSSDILEIDEQIKDVVYFYTAHMVLYFENTSHIQLQLEEELREFLFCNVKKHNLFGLQVKIVNPTLLIIEYILFDKYAWAVDISEKSKGGNFRNFEIHCKSIYHI